jgi:biotin operon repressor
LKLSYLLFLIPLASKLKDLSTDLMGRLGILQDKKDNLIKDLKETALSFKKLGERYGVSRQAVHYYSKRQGIKRPVKPKGHQTEGCRLCQKLIQISKKLHSEFISSHTIIKEIRESRAEYYYHLRTLRNRGLVSQRFGRLHSKRLEKAYAIYFTKRLPIYTIGRKVGINNFYSIIRRYRELRWNVPPPLYVYDGWERSRVQSKIQRRKRKLKNS